MGVAMAPHSRELLRASVFTLLKVCTPIEPVHVLPMGGAGTSDLHPLTDRSHSFFSTRELSGSNRRFTECYCKTGNSVSHFLVSKWS